MCVFAACSATDGTIDITQSPCTPIAILPIDASDAELESIAAGVRMWNDLGANLRVVLPAEQTDQPVEVEVPIRFESAAPMFSGIYRDEIGDVVINRNLTDPDQRAIVVAHEVGHVFGLEHVLDRGSVMNRGNLERAPNALDAAELTRMWPDCELDGSH